MPRGSFNTTCDLIKGPGASSPGSVYSTRDCRLVGEIYQDMSLSPFSLRRYYVTMEGAKPNEAASTNIGEVFSFDFAKADRIALPSGVAANFVVLFVEYVTQGPEPNYYRVSVADVGDFTDLTPVDAGAGGTDCASAVALEFDTNYVRLLPGGATEVYKYPNDISSHMHLNISVDAGGDDLTYVVSQTIGCVSTSLVTSGSVTAGTSICVDLIGLLLVRHLLVEIHNPAGTATTVRWSVSDGACP